MAEPTRRGEIATQIGNLIAAAGVTHVTLTFTAEAATELMKDLRWACKTTVRDYDAEEIKGEVRTCTKSRNK